jgi:hypothetical protein
VEQIIENQVAVTSRKEKSVPSQERVTVSNIESEALERWAAQVKEASKGFLEVSKSDLVNFLIRDHKKDLSAKELTSLRTYLYDPLKHINWITQELKKALARNDFAMVSVLQAEIRAVEVVTPKAMSSEGINAPDAALNPVRRRRKKTETEESSQKAETRPEAGSSAEYTKFI